MKGVRLRAGAALAVASISIAPHTAHAYHVDPAYDRDRTALAVVHPDGRISMSPAAEDARPALSLAKLYLGYYVLYHGTDAEKDEVAGMIASSDDAVATELDAKYPEAIDEIAEDFDLRQTSRAGYWGKTVTSARDVATFTSSIIWDPVAKPLLTGMKQQEKVAKDGFIQGFGTARLERVKGSKMGWADDRESATGSVSWGEIGDETWAVAALTEGSAYQNTVDTRVGIRQVEDQAASTMADYKEWRKQW
ncbi:hypothetical protein [Corynebacterium bouchesdurhonense]|uniref:hypothetical protein n=1 Tax=Corynebacterium bouchesdurhonense TaxID=1720192 RepID=UPI000AC56273|nr:hypothetical protein [Corynebacterium bouchesdurhonense]